MYIHIYVCMYIIYVDITLNIYIFNNNKHIANHTLFFTMHNKFINYNKSANFEAGFLRIIIFTNFIFYINSFNIAGNSLICMRIKILYIFT